MEKPSLSPAWLDDLEKQGCTGVKLAVTDIDGILRGKLISLEKLRSVLTGGLGFCDVVFGWDSGDLAYDNANVTGWHTGYPDALATIDPDTFRQTPWENNLPFFLADFSGDQKFSAICPRSLLKRIIAQATTESFLPVFSQEFEWYNFLAGTSGPASPDRPVPISRGMFGYSLLRAGQRSDYFMGLFDQLAEWQVPLEGLHTETGPGVYEAAIAHAPALEAADRAVLFKAGVKAIAHPHGIVPSFMAKPDESLPGCSGHVHQSLWTGDGKTNLFFAEAGPSELMEQYIAGQLYCLPYLLPMYAPTVNSYKRLVEGAWAPTTVTWATDNRTMAIRALPGGQKSARVETRVVGSDSNPYLAMAACLASGLYGIRNKLTLQPATSGSGYSDRSHGVLHPDLRQASTAMRDSLLARELFGDAFVAHFTGTREWEWRQFSRAVTDWEHKRYFEII